LEEQLARVRAALKETQELIKQLAVNKERDTAAKEVAKVEELKAVKRQLNQEHKRWQLYLSAELQLQQQFMSDDDE